MRKIGDKDVLARYIGDKQVMERYVGEDLISKAWYIGDGLAHHFDFHNNTGGGHDQAAITWADLTGGANMELHNVTFGERSLVFGGNTNAKGTYRGMNVREFTIFNTHLIPSLAPLVHSRAYGENPQPTLYTRSNRDHAYAYYAQGIDMEFTPLYIPLVSQIVRTAIRWAGPGNPVELFIDGVLVGRVGPVNQFPAAAAIKYLGCNSGTTRTFVGEFFEHLVYTRALTDAEILHNNKVSGFRYRI